MSRSPSDKISKDEGQLLWFLGEDSTPQGDCMWKLISAEASSACAGLVECGLVEIHGTDADMARATSAGWARVQAVKAGQIGYQLGMAAAQENRKKWVWTCRECRATGATGASITHESTCLRLVGDSFFGPPPG